MFGLNAINHAFPEANKPPSSHTTRGFCCLFLSMIMPLRDLLTEEEKEVIWENISNRFGFMELSNLSDREKENLIANTWNNIKP